MSPAIAFFPWIAIDEPIRAGTIRLFPYRYKKLPGNLPHAKQDDIDGVVGAYANRPRSRVEEATLLEVGRWKTGCDADKHFRALFRARELLGFCALANRQPFLTYLPYRNYDTYKLIVQRFRPGDPDTFVHR